MPSIGKNKQISYLPAKRVFPDESLAVFNGLRHGPTFGLRQQSATSAREQRYASHDQERQGTPYAFLRWNSTMKNNKNTPYTLRHKRILWWHQFRTGSVWLQFNSQTLAQSCRCKYILHDNQQTSKLLSPDGTLATPVESQCCRSLRSSSPRTDILKTD